MSTIAFRSINKNILYIILISKCLKICFQIYHNCTKDPTPSASNPDCHRLQSAVRDINLETPGVRITLVIENQSKASKGNKIKKKKMQSKRNTACYTNLDEQNGWCATYDIDNLTMDKSLNNRNENVSKC